jgi:hypothetical protein
MAKRIINILSLFLLISVSAENLLAEIKDSCRAGVYLTKDDLVQNHLSFDIVKNKHYKMNFTFPADMSLTLKIIKPDTELVFKPGTIYGYYDCGSVYRYSPMLELNVPEDYYKIEEAKGLVIYSSRFISGAEIYYSLDINSPVRRLTLKNLEADLKDDPDFINAIKKYTSKPGSDIWDRDKDGAFMINNIYRKNANDENGKPLVKQASF